MGTTKKPADDTEESLVGRKVQKHFEGFGFFSGTVVSFNDSDGFYKVLYEDGDREDLEAFEVKRILSDSVQKASRKRVRDTLKEATKKRSGNGRKGEGLKRQRCEPAGRQRSKHGGIDSGSEGHGRRRRGRPRARNDVETDLEPTNGDDGRDATGQVDGVLLSSSGRSVRQKMNEAEGCRLVCVTQSMQSNDSSALPKLTGGQEQLQSSDDEDQFFDEGSNTNNQEISDYEVVPEVLDKQCDAGNHPEHFNSPSLPVIIPLPPSCGDFCLPEDLVAEVFSVYSFLRSFSRVLFLSPFVLHDFVDAVIAETPNNLVDSIHLCLLQSLRRHLQRLSKEGSREAKNCLRQPDWNLLDGITWPSFLVAFLATYGFAKLHGQQLSSLGLLDSEYYKVSPKCKLAVLSFLCDHLLDTEEIRAVLDNRELDWEHQSRQKYRRKLSGKVTDTSNASDDDDSAADEGSVKRESHIATGLSGGESNVHQGQEASHWNSDECVLCGMNGNLICCDGCPAAYHTRCVGISRATLPAGDWFCPECIIEKVSGEQGQRVESLRGGQLLGKDPYGRTFQSTCGYLLVLESKDGLQSSHKYYNKESITEVLQSLEMLKPLCDKVVKAVCQRWQISTTRSAINETKGVECLKELGINLQGEEVERDAGLERLENQPDGSCTGVEIWPPTYSGILDYAAGAENEGAGLSSNQPPGLSPQNEQGLGVPDMKASACHQHADSNSFGISNSVIKQLEGRLESCGGLSPACGSSLSQAKGSFLDLKLPSKTVHAAEKRPICCPLPQAVEVFEAKLLKDISVSSANTTQNRRSCNGGDGHVVQQKRGFCDKTTNVPQERTQPDKLSSPSSYFNHYLFGDAAATAAANLATVTAEEVTSLGKGLKRKTGVTTIAEQLKAFQKTPIRFFWPNHKKKLMEHPKEKCGWCHSCCSLSLKRGCLMNQAVIHLTAGAAAVAGGVRPTKSGSGHFPAVAGYILHIEENLHSLLVGPWENIHFRKLWRKKVEQTSTVHDLKTAILQLEVYLRPIVLTEDWSKSLEDVPRFFLGGSVACVFSEALVKKSSSRSSSRRAPTSRRGCSRSLTGALESIQWSRRGKVAHRVSGWAILPAREAKRAGRQGGSRRIVGLSYAEGMEVSRRSKQYAWRARVQAACSISELAVQVRSLDAHVRWGDLLDLHHTGRKSEDIEALAKGNPAIHARSFKENVPIYLVDPTLISNQECQKNPASYNVVMKESLQNGGKEQVWVMEHEVPLYMLKEFEDQDRIRRQSKAPILSQLQKHFVDCRKRTTKKDVFKYLSERAGIYMTPKLLLSVTCRSCSLKVLASMAVQCHMCKGPFHKECTVMASLLGSQEPNCACRACFEIGIAKLQPKSCVSESKRQADSTLDRGLILDKESRSTLRLKLPLKLPTKTQFPNLGRKSPPRTMGEACSTQSNSTRASSTEVIQCDVKPESQFRLKVLTAALKKPERSERIFWKKNALDSRVLEKGNLLLPGGLSGQAVGPKCHVCRQQYRSDLLYIKCGYCPLWFHGDSVGVSNTNYHEVVGFKCHKCRKKGSPSCPYDAKSKQHRQTSREVLKFDGCKVVDGKGLQNAHEESYMAKHRACLSTLEERLRPPVSAAWLMPTKGTPVKVEAPLFIHELSVEDHNFGSPTPCVEALLEASNCNLTVWPEVQDVRNRVYGEGDSVLDDFIVPLKGEGIKSVSAETNGNDFSTIEEVMQVLYNSDVGTSPQETSDDVCSRAPLSFTELLSSEEDWVEDLAQIGMDFGMHTTQTSDIYLDFVKNSSTSPLFCKGGAAESSGTRSEQFMVYSSQVAHESSTLVAAEKTRGTASAVCSGGFTQIGLHCVGGCGVSLHQQCLD